MPKNIFGKEGCYEQDPKTGGCVNFKDCECFLKFTDAQLVAARKKQSVSKPEKADYKQST